MVNITNYIEGNNLIETQLMDLVASFGPVCVSMHATDEFCYLNGTAIYNDPEGKCPTSRLEVNHAVLLVGYGTDNGTNYWKVRNRFVK